MMPRVKGLRAALLTLAAALSLGFTLSAQILSPEQHFGFRMGADRRLATAEAIERYFETVDAASNRVMLTDLGPTTDGHRTPAAIISAPENIRDLDRIKSANAQLADPRSLSPDAARTLARTQKVVLVIGASIHASEIGGSQAANELLYALASSDDETTKTVLDNVVIILVPMLNPDGHRLVTDWYSRTKGTPFEGGPMPWLYHKYAGHDINRDAFMMNLAENRNLARLLYTEWHPQVFLTMHQMEENGPRFFVPPNTDPIDPNYDPLIWRSSALLGDAMALQMQRDGRTGVVSNAKYDYYWPGFEDSAPLGHNTVCLLTEVASVRIATPITLGRGELRAGFKGLPDYQPQINFPDPWPGGRWTLRDIVDYDLSAVNGLLFAASAFREQLVGNFYEMGRRAVERGSAGDPFAFVIPENQYDQVAKARLEELLMRGAVEIHEALEPFRADDVAYPEGTDVIFLAQPYRAYVKTLLERQQYPSPRGATDGSRDRPYDVTGWTLPDQMGVQVVTVQRPFEMPPTSRVIKAEIPTGSVWGEKKPSYWTIDAPGNTGALALNRLAAAGATVSWTRTPLDVSGFHYAAGSLVVPYNKKFEPAISRVAATLGVRVDGVKGKAPSGAQPVGRARIGLYRPFVESIDEGWTRWVLEQYEFTFDSLSDQELRSGNLRARYDAIIVPSTPPDRIASGFPAGVVPDEYTGGLGAAGIDSLKAFVSAGGTLVCLGQATTFGISTFDLPIRDIAREDDRVFVPGSILKLDLVPEHPLAFGMPAHTAGFFAFSAAFEPLAPADGATTTIARWGSDNPLLSGWLEGSDLLAGRAAAIDARVGTGRVVLLGFPVQHRGQSLATFRLLFNALFTAR
jgi:hypothetical protein